MTAIGPYNEPVKNPFHRHTRTPYFSNIHFNIILHLRLGLASGLLPSYLPTSIFLLNVCYMHTCLTFPDLIVYKLIIHLPLMSVSPVLCYFIALSSEYHPEHFVLKNPQCVFCFIPRPSPLHQP